MKETSAYKGLDIGPEHFLVILTIQTHKRWKKNSKPITTNKKQNIKIT